MAYNLKCAFSPDPFLSAVNLTFDLNLTLLGNQSDAEKDESVLMQDWFNIVHEKNMLVRYESELMVQ